MNEAPPLWDTLFSKHLEENNIVVRAKNASTMGPEDFKNIRFNGFGASDSSKILDVNPFPGGNPKDLLKEKIERHHDETIGHKAVVRMGSELEDLIISKIAEILDKTIVKPSHMYAKEFNGLTTNFDGVLVLNSNKSPYIPAEIKTISMYGRKYYNFKKGIEIENNKGEPQVEGYECVTNFVIESEFAPEGYREDLKPLQKHIYHNAEQIGIPAYYYTQVQQQIDFVNAPYGLLITLDVKEWRLHLFKIPRDQITINSLNARAKKLYDRLKKAREQEA